MNTHSTSPPERDKICAQAENSVNIAQCGSPGVNICAHVGGCIQPGHTAESKVQAPYRSTGNVGTTHLGI
jgi:hypothetical protein